MAGLGKAPIPSRCNLPKRFQTPHINGRLFIGVSLTQGGNRRLQVRFVAHHLDPVLGHFFDLILLPDVWTTAGQRTKLSFAPHLPGAAIIVTNASGAGRK